MAQVPATQTGSQGRFTTRQEHSIERMRHDFDNWFGRLIGGWLAPFDQDLQAMRMWQVDVKENDQEITVRAELPGFEPNEIDVQVDNGVLAIKAEKEQKDNGHAEYRNFYRAITLPTGVDAEKVQARYRNGVLELHIPRAEGSRPRHIQIQGDEGASRPAQSANKQAGIASAQTASSQKASK